jgi:hypothetical protein
MKMIMIMCKEFLVTKYVIILATAPNNKEKSDFKSNGRVHVQGLTAAVTSKFNQPNAHVSA